MTAAIRATGLAAALATLVAGGATAQVASESTAAGQLFAADRTGLQISNALSAEDQGTVQRLIPLFEEQQGGPIGYYTTIAYSPADGLVSEGLQSAVGYHSVAAADRAAIAACNSASASGGCQVAARIVPRGYSDRSLTLSSEATAAFESDYRGSQGPKAMAVSQSTGAWSIARGADAAGLARVDCNNETGAQDCRTVIAD
ncbi:hypothetical protein EKE94_03710 [Mesobaculum littorinae]|uniref:5-aminolevulic acid synthase n=1 Tax=Mesobaculum littorinae TaxID=2486419 RepID=A0A438AMB4_9RHOB|nr:hypothetical protein [Mesobaculum littorinae]RVV99790.1 hypothetical protein EKE94_03710 [Mesobaculum littorinae]